MTAPALAAQRFLWACAIGAILGAVYGFLRPLRRKRTGLGDLIFVAAAVWGWLILSFQICGGDLRLAYTVGLLAGGLTWEWTAGQLLRPIFSGFWNFIGKIFTFVTLPEKKFLKNAKKLFASGEKWVTIKWSNRRHCRQTTGGTPYGRIKEIFQPDSSGVSSQSDCHQGDGNSGARIVYGRTGDPAPVYRRFEKR